uniref:Uncharacterized protein n=1 Tax=Oncorhynchus tshawytscha TaxID=74940 RepID=A0A8C8GPH4_ONCTS
MSGVVAQCHYSFGLRTGVANNLCYFDCHLPIWDQLCWLQHRSEMAEVHPSYLPRSLLRITTICLGSGWFIDV